MTLESPTVGSLFSGIGGFDLGLERAGWRVIWQVEHDVFRQSRLKRHWPHVELRGDIRTETDGLAKPDLICGGFPCQDLSTAGNREGLAGERSGLWFEYLRVVQELRPTWILIENVPGLLSSHEGRDFEVVVSGLTQCGYGVAWRVLDSQYFGVAQRRRRVFVICYLGAPCPPEILFEPEGVPGDPAPRRASREEVDGTLGGGASVRGWKNDLDGSGAFIVRTAQTGSNGWGVNEDGTTYSLDGTEGQAVIFNARQDPIVGKQPLDTDGHSLAVAQPLRANRWGGSDSHGDEGNVVVCPPSNPDGVREDAGVPGRMDTPDGPRYAAIGDAVTVPVADWIGRRILNAWRNES